MESNLEKQAKEAFIDDHFELAVDLYSQAISLNPNNPDLFADRAQAHIKLHNFAEAVADANRAIQLNSSVSKAYLRKGIACMKLEEYQTAKAALVIGASLAPKDSRFTNLIRECDQHITEEAGDIQKQAAKASVSTVSAQDIQPINGHPTAAASPAKPKFRHEFYQRPEEVVVTIYAKGIPASNVVVEFGKQILSVTINVPGEEAYHFQPRLFGEIIPGKSRYIVFSAKVEIWLAKAAQVHWTSLEYSKETAVPQQISVSSCVLRCAAANRPLYSSLKPKGVDWDKLEAQVKKEEKEEKLDGDAALNKFFRDIYADADEDTRRAMSKSFVESNGTVLSTNWKEVGSKKVEGSPPEGMEMKKW